MTKINDSWKQFVKRRGLLWELVKKGVMLKYRKSFLGIFWSLLEPILTTIVLTIVFGTLLNRAISPLYILCGRLLYSFFSSSTKTAAKSIRQNMGMIRKVYVPKYLYPLSCVLYNYIIFVISLIVIIPLGIYCRVTPTPRVILCLVPLLIILGMTYGIGLILTTIDVFFRDIEYIWNVALMVIMYTSAIFYHPEPLLTSKFSFLLRYNPLYCVIANFRHCLFGEPMELSTLLYSIGFTAVVLLVGHIAFYKKQDEFILFA